MLSRSEAASYIEAVLGPEGAAKRYEQRRLDAIWKAYGMLKEYYGKCRKSLVFMPQTELWDQVRDFIKGQDRRQQTGQKPLELPDFVSEWRKQAEYELEEINYERKFYPWTDEQQKIIADIVRDGHGFTPPQVISRSEASDYIEAILGPEEAERRYNMLRMDAIRSEQQKEDVLDPAKYTGTTDPKEQTEILNREIRALGHAGIIGGIPAQKWRNMSPEERLEIILAVPEDERKSVLQNIQSDQNRRLSGRRTQRPGQGPEL